MWFSRSVVLIVAVALFLTSDAEHAMDKGARRWLRK